VYICIIISEILLFCIIEGCCEGEFEGVREGFEGSIFCR
jgi:hypothetical protein